MNILEQEDLIKGLPDQALFQQADNPTGDIPQFLIISEIQRRTDMRKRFEAAEPQPQTTAAQRIVSEGLGAAMASQNSLPPPAMPAPPSNSVSQMDGSSPLMAQGMAAGGILGFSNGGGTSSYRAQGAGVVDDLLAKLVSTGWDATKAGVAATAQAIRNLEPQSTRDIAVEEILSDPENYPDLNPLQRKAEAREQVDESERLRPYREEQEAIRQGNLTAAAYIDKDQGSGLPQLPQIDPAALQAYTGTDYSPMGEIGIRDDSVIPVMTGGGGADVGITTDEMVYGDQLINPTGNETVASQTGTVLPENVFDDLLTKKTITPTSTADAEDYLAALEQSRQGTLDRLDARRSESQELINQIREEGKRDALSAALIQLGAGISSGDMSSGLSQAGSAMTSANALARDAARAEQRGMRDYEEAALSGIDQSAVAEKRFQYDQALAQDAINREQSNLDREYGLSTLTAQQNTLLKLSELDQDAQQFIATNELGRDKLEATLDDIERQYTKEEGIDTRAAVQTFIDHMEQVADYLEDQGARMSVEDKQQYLQAERAKILGALQGRIPDAFNIFRSAINSATTSPSGASLTDFDLETLE